MCNKSLYALKDSKDDRYRLSQDIFCRTSIYNCKPLCVLEELREIKKSGINVFRIDLTFETDEEINTILEAFIECIENDFNMGIKSKKLYKNLENKGITSGHYYKGVE